MTDKPSVLLRGNVLVNDETKEQALIGDLNTLGGVCDDCMHDALHRHSKNLVGEWRVDRNIYDELREAKARIEELEQKMKELMSGVVASALDRIAELEKELACCKAFHDVAVRQRDAAWAEIERLTQ